VLLELLATVFNGLHDIEEAQVLIVILQPAFWMTSKLGGVIKLLQVPLKLGDISHGGRIRPRAGGRGTAD
jgi:hypothetical protein